MLGDIYKDIGDFEEAKKNYTKANFNNNSVIIFGSETNGLPKSFIDLHNRKTFKKTRKPGKTLEKKRKKNGRACKAISSGFSFV